MHNLRFYIFSHLIPNVLCDCHPVMTQVLTVLFHNVRSRIVSRPMPHGPCTEKGTYNSYAKPQPYRYHLSSLNTRSESHNAIGQWLPQLTLLRPPGNLLIKVFFVFGLAASERPPREGEISLATVMSCQTEPVSCTMSAKRGNSGYRGKMDFVHLINWTSNAPQNSPPQKNKNYPNFCREMGCRAYVATKSDCGTAFRFRSLDRYGAQPRS